VKKSSTWLLFQGKGRVHLDVTVGGEALKYEVGDEVVRTLKFREVPCRLPEGGERTGTKGSKANTHNYSEAGLENSARASHSRKTSVGKKSQRKVLMTFLICRRKGRNGEVRHSLTRGK